ncbi:alpha/beta-hydrolase [Saitoella complicata NRRL Y-17804]|uniref:Carboxylic ester hydrolase n=1 Tax=Saitoella complicata (strain BCRC 22490 / CBS 7301 / JCM 7358 / NBRC 10748 / NRRL Y-17804) TaxID=698492 RepID=A0A0E9NS69_SAICN|nr:alpha/beta-hydrolase [Saitoella complicata NRRL Y-17804]ODQ54143.1 alpha/beta-hydrolase [Saitoella complicata NRRL Y-17804]GAO52290.1 hypothetical protein G7K_6370-t1 [Saitoella complicata NRRL Y-17804]
MGSSTSHLEPSEPFTLSLGSQGSVTGLILGENHNVRRFAGIPYAKPPLGNLRWRKPVPLSLDHIYEGEVTGTPLDCREMRNVSPQPSYFLHGRKLGAIPDDKFSEDCLMVNIWTPNEEPPEDSGGWPVFAWIHGGWLQIGSPSHAIQDDPTELIDKDGGNLQAIVVSIGYRLNVFGFLSGLDEVKGNFGFWDQRLGLEWIRGHITHFGGDPENVTLGGLSAGAYSVHAQLNYELREDKDTDLLFQRVIMFSNAIPTQPKPYLEAKDQFGELCNIAGISRDNSPADQLDKLRQVPANELIKLISQMKQHTFRAVTDDEFIASTLAEEQQNGTFAARFAKKEIKIMIGEVENEESVYAAINPPKSFSDFLAELANYYGPEVAKKLTTAYPPLPADASPEDCSTRFGKIVSDVQVRIPIRMLVNDLVNGGVDRTSILRYRISFRPSSFDNVFHTNMGVGHAFDAAVWWFGKRLGLTPSEEKAVKAWLVLLQKLIRGEQTDEWSCPTVRAYRQLQSDGTIAVKDDQQWGELLTLSETLRFRDDEVDMG